MHLNIKIKRFTKDIPLPEIINGGDWIDLRAARDVELKAGEYCLIPLGVGMELPAGYEAIVLPRSSTYKKYGIIMCNSAGVIDGAYKGDGDQWHFAALAVRDTHIPKGERICQFRILENQPRLVFKEVEHLGATDRGGFGSTGRA